MTVAIMQPTYLPWIGYFDLIDQSDIFVFLDDAQVLKRSWGVRNRVLTQNGELFLTVPLTGHNHGQGSAFFETLVDCTQQWANKHLGTIRHAYSNTAYFEEVFPLLEMTLTAGHKTIGALNESFIRAVTERLGIETRFECSSRMAGVTGRKDDRLLAICRRTGASQYLAAAGSACYIDGEGAFADTEIALRYHNYIHPTYQQAGSGFTSHMSIVDLLMNCGFAAALDIIRSGRRTSRKSVEMKESPA